MARYIDAEKAHNLLLAGYEIDDVPTADVQEVKHGKWIPNKFCKFIFYCSECGRYVESRSISTEVFEHFPYCHCGARMDGGEWDVIEEGLHVCV